MRKKRDNKLKKKWLEGVEKILEESFDKVILHYEKY